MIVFGIQKKQNIGKTEFEKMRDKTLEQLIKGQSLTDKDRILAPLLQQFLKSDLESEMNSHLSDQDLESSNKRNGKGNKHLKTIAGEVILTTTR